MPGKGKVAEPGLVGVAPGRGLIITPPVSVCHQVSITGQRPPPITSRYHIQASGLIGSPTVPRMRIEPMLYWSGTARPPFIKARIAVGAV